MIKINNPEECCGCTACASICNYDAIIMKPDALGFLFPEVDTNKCTNCGLCEKVCAFHNNYDKSKNLSRPRVYGARHKNIDDVMKSRSGAVFVAVSDYILQYGGVVYGAGYTDHFRVVHKRATTKEERNEFRGSKYVQSDLTGIFRQVKQDLKNGITVLFSGTPCQTSGLNSYIGEKYREKLFLLDIVCHGVPSPFIWRDYITYIEEKEGDKIEIVNFRDKEINGWHAHIESFVFKEKKVNKNIYTRLFYQHIMLRQSCGNCFFCNTKRPSDITLADFWGWEKENNDANSDDKGLNLVLVNTNKGAELFAKCVGDLNCFEVSKDSYLQPNLIQPSKLHPKRQKLVDMYQKHGVEWLINHDIGRASIYERIKSHLREAFKKLLDI